MPRILIWRRSPQGIFKGSPGFFSLPKRHSAKTLRFKVGETDDNLAPGVHHLPQLVAQNVVEAESLEVLAIAEVPPRSARSESSSSSTTTSTESSSDDEQSRRGVKRRHSPSPCGGRRNNSAYELGSAAPYWMSEEIHHYFINYNNGEEKSVGTGTAGQIGLERPLQYDGDNARNWKRSARQPHCVLASLCFVTVFAVILAAMSSDFYSGLIFGAKGDDRTPAVAVAGGADDRAAPQGSESGSLESQSKEEEQGEGKARKKNRVGPEKTARRYEGEAFDEEADHSDEEAGEQKMGNKAGTNAEEVNRGKHTRLMVTASLAGTTANATKGLRDLNQVEKITFQSALQTKSACGTPLFECCPRRRLEFFYRPSVNGCVSTSSDKVVLCNRGPNRFSSRENCRQNCVEKQQPAEKCRKSAVFSECTRQDVAETWWYHGGKYCQWWTFPNGRCPANGSDIFKSFNECSRRCDHDEDSVHQQHIDGQRKLCRMPRTDVCDAEQLRFAYFADTSAAASGRSALRCRSVPTANQLNHRCLAGENRFQSARACRRTCVVGA
ncbi:hypothetical protein HPB52_016025 [Rhipicephalus sanguineus]|uniref:Uncharacterized protein n=1 Tax=Rhipicephalus sanguineus TaxID=34632 RepID=A0A9D4TAQ8_RHISA|nr:hypothetical protein HPB52_016025 [Rhipicephalus sanguineus]